MKKIILQALAIVFVSYLITSCTNLTPSDTSSPITAECYVRFLQDQNTSLSEVSFYKIQDSLPKPLQVHQINLNGNPMKMRDIEGFGPKYRFTQRLIQGKEVTWSFKKTEKEEAIQSSIVIAPVDSFSFPEGISKKEGTRLKMNTAFFSANESLRILFTPEEGKIASVEVPELAGKNEIKLPGEALISLTKGINKVELIRKKALVDTQGKITFNKVGEYYTAPIQVEVTD